MAASSVASRGVGSRQPRTGLDRSPPRRTSRSPSPAVPGGGRSNSPGPGRRPSTSGQPGRRPSTSGQPGRRPSSSGQHRIVQPQDVKQVFKKFDVNGDGKIDRNELVVVLQELDPNTWDSKKSTMLLMSIDANFDGFINYEEFVDWVSADGSQQTEFRESAGMPRSRAELFKLEQERKQAAEKGTVVELESKQAIATHRLECLKSATDRLQQARRKYDEVKVEADAASKIFMPEYNRFKSESEDAVVPTKELLEHEAKVAFEEAPNSFQLAAQAMCSLFKVHPGTKVREEPDYWTAFLEAILNQKLLFQMDKFEKEHMHPTCQSQLVKICNNSRFSPDKVREDADKMGSTTSFIMSVCLWIHFLGKYTEAGVKRHWDQLHRAEMEVKQAEEDVKSKDAQLQEVRREITRLETSLDRD